MARRLQEVDNCVWFLENMDTGNSAADFTGAGGA